MTTPAARLIVGLTPAEARLVLAFARHVAARPDTGHYAECRSLIEKVGPYVALCAGETNADHPCG
jgi:hypothetical protein